MKRKNNKPTAEEKRIREATALLKQAINTLTIWHTFGTRVVKIENSRYS